MKRRTLLRVILGVTLIALLPGAALRTAAAGPATDPVTSLQVPAWAWRELPGTGGLQVHSTRAVTVTWAAGVVTAGPISLPMPVPGERYDAPGPGWGVAVRRVAR